MKLKANQGTIYRANGTQEIVSPKNKHFSLEELQNIVGGYIEYIYLSNGSIMVVNEDGKIDELPLNVRATEIVRNSGAIDVIVGDALVCPSKLIK